MIMLGENVTAILLTPHCNTADNGAVVVVGLGNARRVLYWRKTEEVNVMVGEGQRP